MRNGQLSRERVQSVVRAIDILFAFSGDRPVLGVSELARLLRLNRTTVHRLLATLEFCGVVVQDPLTHKYRLSARVLQFSNTFSASSDIREVALAPMTVLRDATGETSALHVREGLHRIIVAQVESKQELRLTYPNLGEPVPLHLGAPGKVILAFLPDDDIEAFLSQGPLAKATPYSILDGEFQRMELRQIREARVAVSRQERRLGVVSIAAPIFDRNRAVIASVNISGPIQRIHELEVERFVPLVVEAAEAITEGVSHLEGPLVGLPPPHASRRKR